MSALLPSCRACVDFGIKGWGHYAPEHTAMYGHRNHCTCDACF